MREEPGWNVVIPRYLVDQVNPPMFFTSARLQPAYGRLVAEFKALQTCLLGLKVLGLRLSRGECSVQRVERGLRRRLKTLYASRGGSVVSWIKLLELLDQSLDAVREALLFVNQVPEIREQVLI